MVQRSQVLADGVTQLPARRLTQSDRVPSRVERCSFQGCCSRSWAVLIARYNKACSGCVAAPTAAPRAGRIT